MRFEFPDEWNEKIYNDWTDVLRPVFGDRLALHQDIYEATHAHRIQHSGGDGDGPCTAWPSPLYRAPMWPIVVDTTAPLRFLEIGCGLGYTAALMADAGGPECHIDTIENDSTHAYMAETWLARKGLLERVRVIRGAAEDILPRLDGPYDVIFVDGGERDAEAYPTRLMGPNGVVISKAVLRDEVEQIVATIRASEAGDAESLHRTYAQAEERYSNAVRSAMFAS